MLEFVDSDLYFVQDKNNFIIPLLQVGSGSGFVEKSTGSGGPQITGSGSSYLRKTIRLIHRVALDTLRNRPHFYFSLISDEGGGDTANIF